MTKALDRRVAMSYYLPEERRGAQPVVHRVPDVVQKSSCGAPRSIVSTVMRSFSTSHPRRIHVGSRHRGSASMSRVVTRAYVLTLVLTLVDKYCQNILS